jgi:plastocyanin
LLVALAVVQLRCGENPLAPPQRGANEVWITSGGFDPSSLTVSVNTTVTWTNKDNVKHDVTSGQPGNVESKFKPSPNLNSNETYQATFSQRGRVDYFCLIHGNGHGAGVIIVQ